jgi:hypothetical protein
MFTISLWYPNVPPDGTHQTHLYYGCIWHVISYLKCSHSDLCANYFNFMTTGYIYIYIWYIDKTYLLTAIGLTPGGSSTVHIYTQTVHRTTQLIWEECGPCPVFTNFTLAFALQLRKKHGKTSARVAKPESTKTELPTFTKCGNGTDHIQGCQNVIDTTENVNNWEIWRKL